MYKKASQLKLRVETTRGNLSTEQLWSLSTTELADLVKKAHKKLKEEQADDLDFLSETSKPVSEVDSLTFNILKDVYVTKAEAQKEAQNSRILKEKEQYLLRILEEKKDQDLRGKSIEELESMIAELKK